MFLGKIQFTVEKDYNPFSNYLLLFTGPEMMHRKLWQVMTPHHHHQNRNISSGQWEVKKENRNDNSGYHCPKRASVLDRIRARVTSPEGIKVQSSSLVLFCFLGGTRTYRTNPFIWSSIKVLLCIQKRNWNFICSGTSRIMSRKWNTTWTESVSIDYEYGAEWVAMGADTN